MENQQSFLLQQQLQEIKLKNSLQSEKITNFEAKLAANDFELKKAISEKNQYKTKTIELETQLDYLTNEHEKLLEENQQLQQLIQEDENMIEEALHEKEQFQQNYNNSKKDIEELQEHYTQANYDYQKSQEIQNILEHQIEFYKGMVLGIVRRIDKYYFEEIEQRFLKEGNYEIIIQNTNYSKAKDFLLENEGVGGNSEQSYESQVLKVLDFVIEDNINVLENLISDDREIQENRQTMNQNQELLMKYKNQELVFEQQIQLLDKEIIKQKEQQQENYQEIHQIQRRLIKLVQNMFFSNEEKQNEIIVLKEEIKQLREGLANQNYQVILQIWIDNYEKNQELQRENQNLINQNKIMNSKTQVIINSKTSNQQSNLTNNQIEQFDMHSEYLELLSQLFPFFKIKYLKSIIDFISNQSIKFQIQELLQIINELKQLKQDCAVFEEDLLLKENNLKQMLKNEQQKRQTEKLQELRRNIEKSRSQLHNAQLQQKTLQDKKQNLWLSLNLKQRRDDQEQYINYQNHPRIPPSYQKKLFPSTKPQVSQSRLQLPNSSKYYQISNQLQPSTTKTEFSINFQPTNEDDQKIKRLIEEDREQLIRLFKR